jgi:FKBP-type peptidyl-prolyl cis-trans isomerase 2
MDQEAEERKRCLEIAFEEAFGWREELPGGKTVWRPYERYHTKKRYVGMKVMIDTTDSTPRPSTLEMVRRERFWPTTSHIPAASGQDFE